MGELPQSGELMELKDYKALVKGATSKGNRVVLDKTKPIKGVNNPILDEIYSKFGMSLDNSFFVPGEVMSSKRGHQIFAKPAINSRWKFDNKPIIPFIAPSGPTEGYNKQTKDRYISYATIFNKFIADYHLKKPFFIKFTFIRATKAVNWDFNNMTEVVQDQMVRCGWLKDDSVEFMFPLPPLPPARPFFYDKNNPGVFITILNL